MASFPEQIQRYRRDRQLGEGGMGVVYRYYDPKLGRFVAVKTIPARYSADPERRERFLREAKVLASMVHPNIGAIYDVAEQEGVDYLILEFVPGTTLEDELRNGPLEEVRALDIALQVGRAIEYGHARQVIHRDIKPANIMITPDDRARLLDYGLARHRPRGTSSSIAAAAAHSEGPTLDIDSSATTRVGRIMGSPGYMSPEQATGQPAGRAADVWAFGCVLYECLTGRPAFPGMDAESRIDAILEDDPDWTRVPEGVPASLQILLHRCLDKDPASRLGDIGDACVEIAALQAGGPRPVADAGGTVRGNLPSAGPSYIHRAGEREQLLDMLRSGRLVTLTGPGGCGKTSLALQIGRGLVDPSSRFPSDHIAAGIWYVPLQTLTDPDLVPQAIAKVLWTGKAMSRNPESAPTTEALCDMIHEEIGERRLLLMLDNCEHLIGTCTAIVRNLLQACPNVRILATSREPLGIQGDEQSYPVPALSYPREQDGPELEAYEAVRLFVDRAYRVRPSFELHDQNREAVAAICRRLEGMPQAIELAAARVRSMRVREVAQRLFDVLDPEQVLESSIEWSVRTLTPAQRSMLARLAVFRGGWTLETAESVCGDRGARTVRSRPVVQLLSQLVERSLVQYEERDDRARYHLLETTREYCMNRLLKPATLRSLRRRHLDAHLDLAAEASQSMSGRDQTAWLDRLEIEHENLREALQHAQGDEIEPEIGGRLATLLHRFWYVRGYLSEGRIWLERALRRRPDEEDLLTSQTHNAIGMLAGRMGEYEMARTHLLQAIEILRRLEDRRRVAAVLTNLGLLHHDMGDRPGSRSHHEKALAEYEQLGDRDGIAFVQLNLGVDALEEGDFNEARRLFQESLPVFRARDDRERIQATVRHLGEAARRQGRFDEALTNLRESLRVARDLREMVVTSDTVRRIGLTLGRTKAYETAARLLAASAALRARVDAPLALEERLEYEHALADLREHLDPQSFSVAWDGGSAMTYEQAVALALGETAAGEPPDASSSSTIFFE